MIDICGTCYFPSHVSQVVFKMFNFDIIRENYDRLNITVGTP